VEICTVGSGSVRGESVGVAMVDLNGHEAGNGGYSQGRPTARRVLLYSERWTYKSYKWSCRELGLPARAELRVMPMKTIKRLRNVFIHVCNIRIELLHQGIQWYPISEPDISLS